MPFEELTLLNVAGQGMPEVFQRELEAVMQNIRDINTSLGKRRITLVVELTPFPDRSGASVDFDCNSTLSGVGKKQGGTIYIRTQDGKVKGYTQDQRQELLFAGETDGTAAEVEGETKHAG